MNEEPAYRFEDVVYLKARNERLAGVVTGYIVRPGHMKFLVAWGDGSESDHFLFELCDEAPL